MESVELLLWVILVCLALLAGAVLYLLASRRHYQRVDYARLIDEEHWEKRLKARLDRLEQLLTDLADYDRRRREELDTFAAEARRELADQVRRAREEIVSEVLMRPDGWDRLLYDHSGAGVPSVPGPDAATGLAAAGREAPAPRTLRGKRQQGIRELLEQGHSAQQISRLLGVSRHEVELVAAFVFTERDA